VCKLHWQEVSSAAYGFVVEMVSLSCPLPSKCILSGKLQTNGLISSHTKKNKHRQGGRMTRTLLDPNKQLIDSQQKFLLFS